MLSPLVPTKISAVLLIGLVFILDQLTKILVVHHLALGQSDFVLPILSMTLAYNHGIAFGKLSGLDGLQAIGLTGVVMVVIAYLTIWMCRLKDHEQGLSTALALILGGALGNMIDRIKHGYVVDFIDFHWGNWHWYIFNVADVAITFGVIGMFVLMWLYDHNGPFQADNSAGSAANVS